MTEVVFETPRYGPSRRGIPSVTPTPATGIATGPSDAGIQGEHDLIGEGWIEIDGGEMKVAIRPKGLIGHLEPKEKRSYSLSGAVSWHVQGDIIEVSFGEAGQVASNGATAPSHLGKFRCTDAEAARNLTTAARAAGAPMMEPPRHSGI